MLGIGSTITAATLADDFHGCLRRLREAEPICWIDALGGWLITERSTVLAVLRDPRRFTVDDPRFSTQQVIGTSMLSQDGTNHLRHRAPFEHAFRRGDPTALRARMERSAQQLVAACGTGRADLRTELAGPLAVDVVAGVLGLVEVDAATLLQWYGAIVASTAGISLGEKPTSEGVAAMHSLRRAVEASIEVSPLLSDARTTLSMDEVVSNVAVVLFGGIETSEAMTANAFLHLFTEPGVAERVRARPDLLANFVDESLRLEPAAAQLDRYATEDVQLGAVRIAAGDYVMCSVAGANRDPAVYANPDTFVIGRDNARTHLAFAQGPHACLGNHVAKAETEAALRVALATLTDLRLDEAAPRPHVRGVVFRKASAVPVRWHDH